MSVTLVSRWLATMTKWVGLAVLGIMICAIMYLSMAGLPDPIPPSSTFFELDQVQELRSTPADVSGFIERPLFAKNRRSVEQQRIDSVAVGEAEESGEVIELAGLTLLGVFGSGDDKGIIVADESGERFRVVTGGSVQNRWRLIDVQARGARFQAGGSEATLSLEVASSLEIPKAANGQVPGGVTAKDGQSGEASGATYLPDGPLTFDSMYKQRAALNAKASEAKASETTAKDPKEKTGEQK